jgi:hypothetical protein
MVHRYIDQQISPLLTRTSSTGPYEYIDIDSLPHTVTFTRRVSQPPGDWWVASNTTISTRIRDFNNLVLDPEKDIRNKCQNMFNDDEPLLYRQALSGHDANVWHSAIKGEIDTLWYTYTYDVVDRPMDR